MATTSRCASSRSELRGFAIGLTGGIGSGKTAVADLFSALGAAIVDTDLIAHGLTAPDGAAIGAIAREFGAEYVDSDGGLARQRMRELVFRDPTAKARLEAILHPRIRQRASVQSAKALKHAPYVIFVVPLLVESGGWRDRIDRLLVIDCPEETQLRRVSRRRGLETDLVRRIIAQQASRQQRLDAADDVVVNDGPIEQLLPRVSRLHRHYSANANARRERL
jgi:dephospho-CoA kinase